MSLSAGVLPARVRRFVSCPVLLVSPDPFQILLQWMAKIHVAGQRVHFLAFDEDLHARDRGKIDRQGVDDRVDREELVEGAARVPGPRVGAQVDDTRVPCRSGTAIAASCLPGWQKRAAPVRAEAALR